ncbi:hypothetical protein MGG_15773 [Pyricularia oryzae 70-15]|uniref:Uncharacterized protein n=1 Tax=Pyricularia oryzae (strain 70-15 / ATCC MYA-4617 / FGSC 8958) TaxID=242507 RepID=G4MVU1_PYRO7|nr:uncharacterized protein MGG_15773 [Pyricularia oryzae 70-15]EHA55007.1 hypothetical protein MGG_15773 [Pyricularia oryzae 70-15]
MFATVVQLELYNYSFQTCMRIYCIQTFFEPCVGPRVVSGCHQKNKNSYTSGVTPLILVRDWTKWEGWENKSCFLLFLMGLAYRLGIVWLISLFFPFSALLANAVIMFVLPPRGDGVLSCFIKILSAIFVPTPKFSIVASHLQFARIRESRRRSIFSSQA